MSNAAVRSSHIRVIRSMLERRLGRGVTDHITITAVFDGLHVKVGKDCLVRVWETLRREGYAAERLDANDSDIALLKITGKALH